MAYLSLLPTRPCTSHCCLPLVHKHGSYDLPLEPLTAAYLPYVIMAYSAAAAVPCFPSVSSVAPPATAAGMLGVPDREKKAVREINLSLRSVRNIYTSLVVATFIVHLVSWQIVK